MVGDIFIVFIGAVIRTFVPLSKLFLKWVFNLCINAHIKYSGAEQK